MFDIFDHGVSYIWPWCFICLTEGVAVCFKCLTVVLLCVSNVWPLCCCVLHMFNGRCCCVLHMFNGRCCCVLHMIDRCVAVCFRTWSSPTWCSPCAKRWRCWRSRSPSLSSATPSSSTRTASFAPPPAPRPSASWPSLDPQHHHPHEACSHPSFLSKKNVRSIAATSFHMAELHTARVMKDVVMRPSSSHRRQATRWPSQWCVHKVWSVMLPWRIQEVWSPNPPLLTRGGLRILAFLISGGWHSDKAFETEERMLQLGPVDVNMMHHAIPRTGCRVCKLPEGCGH